MKNIYAKITGALLFSSVALFTFNACTELQDENYTEIVTDQFTPTQEDLLTLIGPAYGNWRGLMMAGNGFFRTQEISADAIVIPARPNGWVDGGIYRRMHEHRWTPNEGNVNQNWNDAFSGITNCNRVIYQIESGQIPVTEGKESLLAELRVLRASYYYVLCDLYGNVPIVTRFDVPEGFLPEQSTRQQVYDFIIQEITEAIPQLSETVDQTTYGRFTKWGAYALLAKMYLNAEVYTGTPQWAQCIEACDIIINSGNFQMAPNQSAVFSTENQGNSEAIFAIPYDEQYASGFSLHMETLQPANQRTYDVESACWGGTCAIPQFIDTYDPEDTRLQENWIQGQQYSSSGEPLVGAFGAFNGEPLVFINELPGVDSSEVIHGFRLGKYEFQVGLLINLSNDVPLLRYTDVLMMKAECLLRTGNPDGAAEIVTQVRERSFMDNPEKAVVTGPELLEGSVYVYGPARNGEISPVEGGEDIQYGRFLDELGWEFAMEGRRRQDMIRFGIFTEKSWLSHTPNGDYRKLLPIPDNILNTNPNLTQNPGY